jgi:hypothetical protein
LSATVVPPRAIRNADRVRAATRGKALVLAAARVNARLTDEQYLAEMESVERDADDYIDRTRQIERALKDRVREALGLPQRTNKNEVNLVHHTRINGITPSYI